jgi:hypothetical protein
MGGNALKEYGARRVTAAEANDVSIKVCAAIDEIFLEHGFDRKSHQIEAYRQKADYGDLDIVVLEEAVRFIGFRQMAYLLEQKLGVTMPFYHHHPNAKNFSVGYPLGDGSCLQIDLMFANASEYDFSCKYYSFNDLGNLMTIIAKRMDKIKFGHAGLSSVFKENGHIIGTVIFTQDFDAALRFLGYDPERHRAGFDTLEDIYQFAASSPYFSSDIYLLENRNHDARMRDRKRSTYSGFLKWIAETDLPQYQWPEKGDWVQKAMQAFPDAALQLQQMTEAERKRKEVRLVFNGQKVATLTGLSSDPLGLFMESFKKHVGEKTFFDFILDQSREDLDKKILAFYEIFNKLPRPDALLEDSGRSPQP